MCAYGFGRHFRQQRYDRPVLNGDSDGLKDGALVTLRNPLAQSRTQLDQVVGLDESSGECVQTFSGFR